MARARAIQQILLPKQFSRIDIAITTRPDISRCSYQDCVWVRGVSNVRPLQASSFGKAPLPKRILKTKSTSQVNGHPSAKASSTPGQPARGPSLKSKIPSMKDSKGPAITSQPVEGRPGPNASETQPTAKTASFRQSQSLLQSRLETLFRNGGDEVLLYRSRNTTAFTFWSMLFGAGLLLGGGVTIQNIYGTRPDGSRSGWLVLASGTASTAFFIIMGSVVFWAPLKCLKSVTAVANRGGPLMEVRPTLVFEMSRILPGMRKQTFELAPQDVFLDRRLVSYDVEWQSVPLSRAASFTREYQNSQSASRGIGQRLVTFNRSLVNIWPETKTAVRQMLLREGFAKVYCRSHGLWKMNMHEAEVLEAGQPLRLLSSEREEDEERGYLRTFWNWLRVKLS